MAAYVGLDWANKGWFGVALDGDRLTCDLFPTIWSAWHAHRDADRILVDIPIGLPDRDGPRRRCDERAKSYLGELHASVFYAPVRPAIYRHSITEAKAVNEEAGFSIQNQAWSLVPRIREVDEFMDARPGARDRMRETHPEVCYRAWHGGSLSSPPNTAAGREERYTVIVDAAPELREELDRVIESFTTPRYAPMVTDRSHIQDACIAALTARCPDDELATLPAVPPTDARELPMEIVYPSTARQLTLGDTES